MQLNSADLVVPRMEAWRLLWDFRCVRPALLILLTFAVACWR